MPLETAARELLDAGWREGRQDGRSYAFTVPSPASYPWQWYWDSAFHAIVRRRFDPERARRELETLLHAAEPDGFIGHTIFWERPLDRAKALRYNVRHRHDFMTRTIEPPILALAWDRVAGEPAAQPVIVRHHHWLRAERDLDGDGLLWLIQPDESGMDALPKFDHVWGSRAQGLPLFPLLIARNRRLGFDARRIAAAGGPVLCEVLTNVVWSLSEQALGRPSPTPALVERLWDARLGRFRDVARNPVHERAADELPLTWDTLAPLALPDLPDDIAGRLLGILDRPGFRDAVPLPAVAVDDPAHDARERFWLGVHRHWRGPSWVNAAWFVALGLRRLGREEQARDMGRRLAAVMEREGFREYYDARTGAGMGAEDFAWSTLVLDLLAP